MFGVVIVSIVVVTVMNLFEMNNLELKAYTVINKLTKKRTMRYKASQVITKLSRLYLKVKNNEEINISKIYDLNNDIETFKEEKR